MAGKHSDAKRIKQVDNLYGKADFTIYKLPAELPLIRIQIYTLIKVGSSDINIFWSKSKEKKKKEIFEMARGKDVKSSKASQPVKMSMNFFTRE